MPSCARCGYPSRHREGDGEAPCPECGMLPQQAAAWREHKRRSARRLFALSIAIPAVVLSVTTAILHAKAAIDVAFLCVLVLAGYVPLVFAAMANSLRSRLRIALYLCGASIGVYVSFWSPPRLAYEPVAGVLLVPLVMGTIGMLFVAITCLVPANANRSKS